MEKDKSLDAIKWCCVFGDDFDGMDFFCPNCGSVVVVDHGLAQCEGCGWIVSGDILKEYV